MYSFCAFISRFIYFILIRNSSIIKIWVLLVLQRCLSHYVFCKKCIRLSTYSTIYGGKSLPNPGRENSTKNHRKPYPKRHQGPMIFPWILQSPLNAGEDTNNTMPSSVQFRVELETKSAHRGLKAFQNQNFFQDDGTRHYSCRQTV